MLQQSPAKGCVTAVVSHCAALLLSTHSARNRRCPSFSAIWLMVMNVLYFVLGLAMIGMSSWGIQTQAANPDAAGEFAGRALREALRRARVFRCCADALPLPPTPQ